MHERKFGGNALYVVMNGKPESQQDGTEVALNAALSQ
ncbi:hypothetical protein M2131_000407 [Polynucleobacter sphagniphilus]|nr:hypothetical protein [Polynucleobacter sphagniphilus]